MPSDQCIVTFVGPSGTVCEDLAMPVDVTVSQLSAILNKILSSESEFSYFLTSESDQWEISSSLDSALKDSKLSTESTLTIRYFPLSPFKVSPASRLAASVPAHNGPILCLALSPCGTIAVTGAGDSTVVFWDTYTFTPAVTKTEHKHWVMSVEWDSFGTYVASGGKDEFVVIYRPDGEVLSKINTKHKGGVMSLHWQPGTVKPGIPWILSGGKDGIVKIWDIEKNTCLQQLSASSNMISGIRWVPGGIQKVVVSSRDREISVWDTNTWARLPPLKGHALWVNHISSNVDWILRGGGGSLEELRDSYEAAVATCGGERLASCSEDHTIILWDMRNMTKLARITGHAKSINQICFSPDGSVLASAGFDTTVRLWDGLTGKALRIMKGHVQPVYRVCWGRDSRTFVSASADSTIKVWTTKDKKILKDVPGHADEIFAIDWSHDGRVMVSGGKDRHVNFWMH